jgi:hypothetical protein
MPYQIKKILLDKFDYSILFLNLVLLVCIAIVFMPEDLSRDLPISKVNSLDTIPSVTVMSGTYGPEFQDNSWLKGNFLELKVVNPAEQRNELGIEIKLGKTPCGLFPKLSSGLKHVALTNSEIDVALLRLVVGAKKMNIFRLRVSGKPCQIDSDPRIFIGSITDPKIKIIG